MLTEQELVEIEAWNAGGNYSGRPTEIKRDVAALVETVRKLRAAMEETREPAWIIRYEDQDRADEIFSGAGATEAALHRFDMMACGYNCHLFRRVAVG